MKIPASCILPPGSVVFIILFLFSSCAGPQMRQESRITGMPSEVRSDLTVSGDIRIRGEVKVFSGAVLTVAPGTHFTFEPWDPDGDGVNDSRLVIEGRIVARGEPDAPIFFSSASSKPEPGDWLEMRIDRSEGNVFEYCVLEHSRYGLHVHFSSGMVVNCVLRNNIDGTRFGNSRFDFHFNRVTQNLGMGINSRASRLLIGFNAIDNNRHGIFLSEEGSETGLVFNRFVDNELSDLRFGDFYNGDPPEIYGNSRPDGSCLGIVGFKGDFNRFLWRNDVKSREEISGPQYERIHFEELWKRDLGSFIDASPLIMENGRRLIVPTWEDGLHVLDTKNGETISRIEVPATTDVTPALLPGYPVESSDSSRKSGEESVIFPSWDRRIRKANVYSGEILGEIRWDPSPADDHRQAAPLDVWLSRGEESAVALGLWNGQLGLLDPGPMQWLWTVQLDGAIRARAVEDDGHLWVGTDAGSLYKISREGEIQYRLELGAPIRSAPLVIEKGGVIVVTGAGLLLCVKDNKILWRRQLRGSGTSASPSWLVPSERYFVVGDSSGHLYAYSTDGALMWVTDVDSAIHVITGGDVINGVFAGTEDGSLVLFDWVGRLLFKSRAEGSVHSAAFDYDLNDVGSSLVTVYWGSRDGSIRAVQLTEKLTPWEIPE